MVAVICAVPVVAFGSSVSVGQDGVVEFQANPGERNVVSYSRTQGGFTVRDAGAPLTSGSGCTSDGSGGAQCVGSAIVVHAGDGDDTVAPSAGELDLVPDTVYGEEGDDTLSGSVVGGPGADSLTPVDRFDSAYGGPGDDVLTASGDALSLEGGDGSDRLTADFLYGTADGGDGNDEIDVQRASATGGPGNDRLVARGGGEALDGGEGDDVLLGSRGRDRLLGGAGSDVITDNAEGEIASTTDALNELSGGPGDDVLSVGGDKLPLEASEPGITITGLNASRLVRPVASTVDGGPGNDRIVGGPNRDLLSGGPDNDTIEGGDGFDRLLGDEGDDSLEGGGDSDRLVGGPGADVIAGGDGEWDAVDLSTESSPVAIDLRHLGGDGPPGENDTYLPGVDEFILTAHADRFVAGSKPVAVAGGFGEDVLIGSPAGDQLVGDLGLDLGLGDLGGAPPGSDFGDDTIDGRGGDDTIEGSAGSDTLSGGRGDDELSGTRAVVFFQGTVTRYPSDDTIFGGRGDDAIRYGWRASGGPGDDSIDVADFDVTNRSAVIPVGRDGNVRCGAGRDGVNADYYDGVALDCEKVHDGAEPWRRMRTDRRGRLPLLLRCAWELRAPCRGSARLVPTSVELVASGVDPAAGFAPPKECSTTRGAPLASRLFTIRAGRVARLTLTLRASRRKALARAGCLLVRADVRLDASPIRAQEVTRTLALRPRASRAAESAGGRFGPGDRETLLISRSAGGGFPNGASRNAAISGDYQLASLVAFDSDASDIISGDTNGVSDVFFVRRRRPYSIDGEPWRGGGTSLVSRARDGGPANGASYRPDLSGDRHHRPHCIAVVSDASNLVRGDTNGVADAFVQDLRTHRTRRVSLSTRGAQANGETTEVQVDGACKRVAFVSTATNLTPARTHGKSQVYLRARRKTALVSRSHTGRAGNGASNQISLSRVAPVVAYASTATNIAPRDHNRTSDVYVARIARSRVRNSLVSRTRHGGPGNGASDQPDIAAAGQIAAFRTSASNLLAHDENARVDVAVANTARPGRFRWASRSEALGEAGNGDSAEPTAVEPGTNVFFSSLASNLQSTVRRTLFDRNDAGDVFFWSALSGNVSLQSRDSDNQIVNNRSGRPFHDQDHVPQAPAENPAVSYYGNYMLFESPYPLIDLRIAANEFPGLTAHDAAVMSNTNTALRQVYLRYVGPR